VIVRTYQRGDEAAIVDLLNASFPGGWGTLDIWRRRHTNRLGFDPRDICVAEDDGRVIGCLHTARFELSLGRNISVPAALDADLAVHSAYRARGVPDALYRFSADLLTERGVVVRQGFSDRMRGQFYARVLGYTQVSDQTEAWSKCLDPNPVAVLIESRLNAPFGEAAPGPGPILEVVLTDLPPMQFQLGRTGALRVESRPADLMVNMPQSLLSLFSESSRGSRLRRLCTEILRGRLRVRPVRFGAVSCVLRLVRYGFLHRVKWPRVSRPLPVR
jgi:predicted N-acetyltransferase YhbS